MAKKPLSLEDRLSTGGAVVGLGIANMIRNAQTIGRLVIKNAKKTIREAVEALFDEAQFKKSRKLEKENRDEVKDIVDDKVEFKED